MRFISLLLLTLTTSVFAQRTQTIDADCLRIKDGICVDKNELGYLDGATSNVQTQIDAKAPLASPALTGTPTAPTQTASDNSTKISTTAYADNAASTAISTESALTVHKAGSETITGDKLFTGQLTATSTTKGNRPCPTMTETQRNAVSSPALGDCVYNTTTGTLNVYNGTTWASAGGGLSAWITAANYSVGDVVIESNKIYKALTAHTSGTFATDLAATKWVQLANNVSDSTGTLPLANGGTNKALTAVNGGIVYTDTDSQEISAAGTSGQVLQSNGAAAPTFVNKAISGKAQSSTAVTLEELQAPNKLLTQTATGKYLHETGNNNLLTDPSLEGANVSSAWTLTAGTFTIDNTPIHGAINGLATLSAQSLSLTQDSTLYATQFADGVQGLAYMRVRTSITSTPIYLCPRQAGVTAAVTNCATIVPNGKWSLYKVPFILGATSNGIALTSNAVSITGDVEWDEAFVGAVDLKQDVDQSRIAGESYFAGTTSCSWSRTNTAVGAFTAVSACPGPTIVRSTMGSWQTTDSDLPRQTINNLPEGTYKVTFIARNEQNAASAGALAITDGTTTCEPQASNVDTIGVPVVVSCTFQYSTSGNRSFELYGSSNSSTINIPNSQTSARSSTKFILEYFGSGQIYSSSCGANCVDTFSAEISTTGVVSNENVDWINGNCVVTATSYYACTYRTGLVTVPMNCTVSGFSNTVDIGSNITTNSSTAVQYSTTSAGAASARGAILTCQKQGVDFTASRTIVGSFKEIPTTIGSNGSDIQSVYFGSSADCSTACTTGTCTICKPVGSKITSVTWQSTGIYRFNGIDGTKYTCTVSGLSGSDWGLAYQPVSTQSSTYTQLHFATSAGTLGNAEEASVHCIGIP